MAAAPSSPLRLAISLAVGLHLVALTVSLSSGIEVSDTQAKVLGWFTPYLQATHFGLDDRPIYLAHGDRDEQPLRLQTAASLHPEEADWETMAPPGITGLAGNDRYHRWLKTAVMLAESDQSALVAELLLPVVATQDTIQAIRIVRLPTELTTLADDAEPPPYQADVIRAGERVSLVKVPVEAQGAIAIPRSGGAER